MASKKVRIAVAIDSSGRWAASGASGLSDDYCMTITAECVDRVHSRYVIEAWVDVPEPMDPKRVEGQVVRC